MLPSNSIVPRPFRLGRFVRFDKPPASIDFCDRRRENFIRHFNLVRRDAHLTAIAELPSDFGIAAKFFVISDPREDLI